MITTRLQFNVATALQWYVNWIFKYTKPLLCNTDYKSRCCFSRWKCSTNLTTAHALFHVIACFEIRRDAISCQSNLRGALFSFIVNYVDLVTRHRHRSILQFTRRRSTSDVIKVKRAITCSMYSPHVATHFDVPRLFDSIWWTTLLKIFQIFLKQSFACPTPLLHSIIVVCHY